MIVAASTSRMARDYRALGVTMPCPRQRASLQLGEAVLDEIGIPIGMVIAGIHQRREDSRRALGRKDRRREANRRAADGTSRQ